MIYISSSSVKGLDLVEGLTRLINAGIKNIELSGGNSYSPNITETLKKLKHDHDLNFLIHNYFPPPEDDFILNLASSDKKQRRQTIDFVKSSINLASELKIDRYALHAGYTRNLLPPVKGDEFVIDESPLISEKDASNFMIESIFEIENYGTQRGVTVGVENLFPFGGDTNCSLLCTPSAIFSFLENTREKNIGFLLDLGHLSISSEYFEFDKYEFLDELGKNHKNRLLEFHVSGNDGKNDLHNPLTSDSWQLKAIKKLDARNVPVVIECRGITAEEAVNQFQIVEKVLMERY